MDSWKEPLTYGSLPQSGFDLLSTKLRELGYRPKRLSKIMGLSSEDDLYPLDYRFLPRWDRKLSESPEPLAPIIRLLLLALAEDVRRLEKALGSRTLDFILETGLAFRQGEAVHPRLSIFPFRNLFMVTDRLFMNADPESPEEGLSSDNCVWRLDRTTLIMAKTMPRRKAGKVLELGCGSGVLSLLAAKEASNVTGVDINPRAVNVAGFNARLNKIENVEFVQGDLFQPVGGRCFDLIFSNPPSAPGLVRGWNREGGSSGRELIQAMIAGLPGYLSSGGLFQCTIHFGYQRPGDIKQWLGESLPDGGFQFFYKFYGPEEKAPDYALREAHQKAGVRDYPLYDATYRWYLENLEKQKISRIRFGVLRIERKTVFGTVATGLARAASSLTKKSLME